MGTAEFVYGFCFKNPHSKTKQNKKKKIQKYPNVPSDHSVATPVYGSMLLHARCVWFLLRNSYTDSVLRIHTAKQNKTKKRKSKNIRMYPVTTVSQPQCMVLCYYTPAVSGSYCGIRIRILFLRIHTAKQNKTKKRKSKNIRM